MSLLLASTGTFGCAVADYGRIAPALNKTTGISGCESGTVFNTTVQTIVPQTQQLYETARDTSGNAICPNGANPQATLARVSRQDAMDWNFCVAAYALFAESEVMGGRGDGTWALAGVKDLDDGTVRLNGFHAPGVYRFSCVGSGLDGTAPESSVIGDGFSENGAPPRLPGLHPDYVAIDRNPGGGCEMCANVAAISALRAREGFSTFYCLDNRISENRVRFTPQCRREGPAALLSGQAITVEIGGVTITGRGTIDAGGGVSAELLGLAAGGATYEAHQPIAFQLDVSNPMRSIKVWPSDPEEVALARFALDAGLTDRPLAVGGMTEYGVEIPHFTFMLSGATLRSYLAGVASGGGGRARR